MDDAIRKKHPLPWRRLNLRSTPTMKEDRDDRDFFFFFFFLFSYLPQQMCDNVIKLILYICYLSYTDRVNVTSLTSLLNCSDNWNDVGIVGTMAWAQSGGATMEAQWSVNQLFQRGTKGGLTGRHNRCTMEAWEVQCTNIRSKTWVRQGLGLGPFCLGII